MCHRMRFGFADNRGPLPAGAGERLYQDLSNDTDPIEKLDIA